jgi:FKBP-type peptidyl-prolyl cis-trans isomerase
LKLAVLQTGKGRKIVPGDKVEIHLKGMLPDGSVFASSYKNNKTILVLAGVGKLIPGLDEGILFMNEGSKVIFRIPSKQGYGEAGLTHMVPSGSELLMEVELIKILPGGIHVIPFDVKGKDTLVTKHGIRYIPVVKTSGTRPGKRSEVSVNYTGYLPGGRIFDTTIPEKKPFVFDLGDTQIIKGWNEGIALMKEGEKFRFIIPWKLAYGKKGLPPNIPSKTDLIFDIELVEIR